MMKMMIIIMIMNIMMKIKISITRPIFKLRGSDFAWYNYDKKTHKKCPKSKNTKRVKRAKILIMYKNMLVCQLLVLRPCLTIQDTVKNGLGPRPKSVIL